MCGLREEDFCNFSPPERIIDPSWYVWFPSRAKIT